jgi:S1-C subfamily serine protease
LITLETDVGSRFLRISWAGAVVAAVLVASSSSALGASPRATTSASGVKAGVVAVNTRLAYGGGASAGTGIVLTSSGQVLTNNHVIRGAGSIRVTVPSTGRTYTATVAGYSVAKDIALLKLRNASGLQTMQTVTSSTVRVGDRVTAVGNAGGSGTLSAKAGTVTGLGQTITVADDGGPVTLVGLIETTAELEPGDSGGPMLSGGRVIGLNAAASSGFAFRDSGQGYAVPIARALTIAAQIEAGRSSSTVHVGPTAFLGVALARPLYGADVEGALVEGVAAGSPAAKAGIGQNDVITAFGGKRVTSAASLKKLVLRSSPGRTVRITWIDAYSGKTNATVRLAAGPPQ